MTVKLATLGGIGDWRDRSHGWERCRGTGESAATAFGRRLRCPKDTPIFSGSASVRSLRTSASMSFFAK